jgi:hypothetical protein
MPVTRSIAKKLRPIDVNYDGKLTRNIMNKIRKSEIPFEFNKDKDIEIISDSESDDSDYIDGIEILGNKQKTEECIQRCITFTHLNNTNNFKRFFSELKLEDIDNEIIRGYFNGLCNKKYEELNKQYEIEKTQRLQQQIKNFQRKEYATSFCSHISFLLVTGFLSYLLFFKHSS